MANIIRAAFALFWLVSTGFIGFLAYTVIRTEANPQALWGWLVMCGFIFVSATFLTYNIVFGQRSENDAQPHDSHPHNS